MEGAYRCPNCLSLRKAEIIAPLANGKKKITIEYVCGSSLSLDNLGGLWHHEFVYKCVHDPKAIDVLKRLSKKP